MAQDVKACIDLILECARVVETYASNREEIKERIESLRGRVAAIQASIQPFTDTLCDPQCAQHLPPGLTAALDDVSKVCEKVTTTVKAVQAKDDAWWSMLSRTKDQLDRLYEEVSTSYTLLTQAMTLYTANSSIHHVKHPEARLFWARHFPQHSELSWLQFEQALRAHFRIDDTWKPDPVPLLRTAILSARKQAPNGADEHRVVVYEFNRHTEAKGVIAALRELQQQQHIEDRIAEARAAEKLAMEKQMKEALDAQQKQSEATLRETKENHAKNMALVGDLLQRNLPSTNAAGAGSRTVRKLIMIGSSGSGKTCLALQLSLIHI